MLPFFTPYSSYKLSKLEKNGLNYIKHIEN